MFELEILSKGGASLWSKQIDAAPPRVGEVITLTDKSMIEAADKLENLLVTSVSHSLDGKDSFLTHVTCKAFNSSSTSGPDDISDKRNQSLLQSGWINKIG